jgi:hypothetical protein
MTTKQLQSLIDAGPFAGRDLTEFFGTKKAADRFLMEFTEARDTALREFRNGAGRSIDCTFPEQFWDGQLFLDSDDMYDRGINRQALASFRRDAYVADEAMECDVHLIRNGRERVIVIDWTWKDDEYALDAWLTR